jgi:uncharacterized membrane protein
MTIWTEWRVPAGLILLTAVPGLAGAARVAQLAEGGPVTAENARFFAMPLPVLVHIFGATTFCVLGAFQFAGGFRRRRPGWHRIAGRILVPCGVAAAASGLWMTIYYPKPVGDGPLLEAFRLLFGTAMLVSLVLGLVEIRRRRIRSHQAWMIRGYAIGLGAGTQVLTNLPWVLLVGTPGEFARALLMAAGWVINLAMAEWVIRRGQVTRPRGRDSLVTVSA